MFSGASETLRLSGIEEDISSSGRYDAIRPRVLAMDRATQLDEIRRLLASPDVIVGSVAAVTETGSLVVASASGSQLPGYAGGAARAIWIVGAQKVVPDLSTALRRVDEHCLPLESERAMQAYGQPSVVNRLLILNARTVPRARHRPAAPRSHRILRAVLAAAGCCRPGYVRSVAGRRSRNRHPIRVFSTVTTPLCASMTPLVMASPSPAPPPSAPGVRAAVPR